MCAKDRSHIAVRSQTDSIHSMREMLNISSCPAFIRDSRGEVIHTSPTFDKIFLTSGGTGAFDTPRAPGSWFLDLSLEIKLELMQSELKSFSEGQRGAERKRANRLARYSRERQIHEMSLHILKTMPADEAYWCTTERLQQLAIQNLYQLELALAPPS